MIHVNKCPEPVDFDVKVRRPGLSFLATCPNPKTKDWRSNNYWKKANTDLYSSYGGVCAYTGEWFSLTTSSVSVDHFLPKSRAPHLAFEWDNYRLTTQKANNNKADYIIIDPFNVQLGWFALAIPSCLIVAGDNLASETCAQVEFAIEKLKLNSDEEYVERRYETIIDYIRGDISFTFLQRRFPFIAIELERKNLKDADKLKGFFKYLPN
ncbi:MAG: hypothetical protein LBE95_00210 [Holosporaceae bacterium]|jgi:hypothetical protein|nr:hypothetical protein [Holosporaceae bacterium]